MTDHVRKALADVTSAAHAFLETTENYDQLLATVARSCAGVLHGTCTVSLIDAGGETITPVAMHDEDPELVAAYPYLGQSVSIGASAMRALRDDGVLFAPNAKADGYAAAAPGMRAFLESIGALGYIAIAMRVRGEMIGILAVFRRRADLPPLDERERGFAVHLAHLAGLAIANARAFRSAEHAAQLRDVTTFVDAVLENIPAMVFVKDAERLAFVRMNRAGEELLGISREQLIGKTDFDFFPKDEAEFFVEKDRATLHGESTLDIPEEPIATSRGERWLHTRKVPLRDAAGVPRWLVGISHDITELKQHVTSLRAAKDAAEAANRELEAFSYSVAHDLRTPLRSIDGFSQALLEDFGDQLGAVGSGHLHRVRAAAQRMATLIDDLLMLSRVTRSELKRSHVDLGELFRTSLATLQRLEPDRNVAITIGGELRASADPQQLAIAFDNLCGNAWKFTSKRAAARIEIGSRVEAGERVFFVRDNGVGFDMQYAGKLFGVFQRLHADSEFPGTGIGLATVQRIIQRHGGRVWATGEVGQGAMFSFTLGG
jgi:PAS domain S-box-containing protein